MGEGERTLDYPIPGESALRPPKQWENLRQECPVAHVRLPSGDSASLVTRYDDVKQVLSDSRFTRELHAPDAARISTNESGGVFNNSGMSQSLPRGGEGHQRWRRMVGKWFTAKRMNQLRPGIEDMADRLIDEMVASGAPADLKAALGFPLPVWVICDLLGVPDTDRDRFSYWSDVLLNLTRYDQREMDEAREAFLAYMSHHVAAKRDDPGEDLLSELIVATDSAGETLPDAALVATGQGLLVAGHETTANMIGKMVAMLLADRGQWEQLLANRSLVRTAVEETLRADANQGFGIPRYITEPTDVAGQQLEAGTTVICSMSAANRDAEMFAGAEELDLRRSPNPHLAFGAGAHSCLGQALARTELQAVLDVLLRRLPTLELAVDPADLTPVSGLVVGGLSEVPVKW